jgi:hypothetical protein
MQPGRSSRMPCRLDSVVTPEADLYGRRNPCGDGIVRDQHLAETGPRQPPCPRTRRGELPTLIAVNPSHGDCAEESVPCAGGRHRQSTLHRIDTRCFCRVPEFFRCFERGNWSIDQLTPFNVSVMTNQYGSWAWTSHSRSMHTAVREGSCNRVLRCSKQRAMTALLIDACLISLVRSSDEFVVVG